MSDPRTYADPAAGAAMPQCRNAAMPQCCAGGAQAGQRSESRSAVPGRVSGRRARPPTDSEPPHWSVHYTTVRVARALSEQDRLIVRGCDKAANVQPSTELSLAGRKGCQFSSDTVTLIQYFTVPRYNTWKATVRVSAVQLIDPDFFFYFFFFFFFFNTAAAEADSDWAGPARL
jgi:hypothetical protein